MDREKGRHEAQGQRARGSRDVWLEKREPGGGCGSKGRGPPGLVGPLKDARYSSEMRWGAIKRF